ncbi:sensor histidine kinase [Actinomadura graeca]|uniref:sensor histidine kinase n=1 Tax=Actinomadura graeca TaxID=2750812 RepID=UPI001E32BF2E|nr:histidine kinase [Actinomadura graeca]
MFVRSFSWLRAHPRLVDSLWALPLVWYSVLTQENYRVDGMRHYLSFYYAFVVALTVPMIWRRRWPREVFAVVCLVGFVQLQTEIAMISSDLNVLVAMYTVAANLSMRWSLASFLVVQAGVVASVGYWWPTKSFMEKFIVLLPSSITTLAVWLSGLYVNTRRMYTRSLEERAVRLEAERDAQAQVAAAAERARIAREMHDVIAHSVSVMVVQADGGSYMLDVDPDRARRALEMIGTTGRQALTEMRRMLGVLREGGQAGTYAPQPGIDQLTELVEQIRTTGLTVDLAIEGTPLEMPAALQLAVYRIIQEALTNARKHGGPRVTAQVRLHYGDDAVLVDVSDDGRGAAALSDGQGHGLVGMGERVALFGGWVRTGPRPGGGFTVSARIPVPEPAAAG